MYEHLVGKELTPKQKQIVENTINASPETIEMAQRIACFWPISKGESRKHIYELVLENLAQLEYKIKERLMQEMWDRGPNGPN